MGLVLLIKVLPSPQKIRKDMLIEKTQTVTEKSDRSEVGKSAQNKFISTAHEQDQSLSVEPRAAEKNKENIERQLAQVRQKYLMKQALEPVVKYEYCQELGRGQNVIKGLEDGMRDQKSMSWNILNGPELEFLRLPSNKKVVEIISYSKKESWKTNIEFYYALVGALREGPKYWQIILKKSENYRQMYNLYRFLEKYPQLANDKGLRDFCEKVQGQIWSDSLDGTELQTPQIAGLLEELKINHKEFEEISATKKDVLNAKYDQDSGDINLTFSAPWADNVFSTSK